MNDYYQVRIDVTPCSEDATDLLAALLADHGYESFVPDDTGLTAYVKADDYSAAAVDQALADMPFDLRYAVDATLVPGQDWNAEWERNYFQPIIVGGDNAGGDASASPGTDSDCVIHSSFHTDVPKAKYDIVIDPKMAFGTGHHSTTSLIIRQLLGMDLDGLHVIDMGTGTGILAILAAMRGAAKVDAVEIDPFAYDNAVDNVAANGHPEIRVHLGDASALADIAPADVFIANINRNIITADMTAYAAAMRPGALLLLSGFYESDIPILVAEGAKHGLTPLGHTIGGEPENSGTGRPEHWACLRMKKE